MLYLTLTLCLTLLWNPSGWGQSMDTQSDQETSVEQTTLNLPTPLKLGNGMKLLVVQDPSATEVTWELTFDYPPFLEGEKAGLKQLVADVLMAGTSSRSRADITSEIEALDARFEANAQGFTAQSSAAESANLLRIVSDVVLNPLFQEEEIVASKERLAALINSQLTSANAMAENVVSATTFGNLHPYGEIMTLTSLEAITKTDLEEFHSTYFRPNAGILTVVGDITPDAAFAKANSHFGKWMRGNIPFSRIAPASFPKGNQVRFVSLEESSTSTIVISQPVPYPPGHPDAAAIDLMSTILGGQSSQSRLTGMIPSAGQVSGQVSCSLIPDPLTAKFEISWVVPLEATGGSIEKIMAEINRMRDEAVSDGELNQAKELLINRFMESLDLSSTVSDFALNIDRYDLPKDHFEAYLKRLNDVTSEDIQRVAKNMIKPNNLNICVVAPAIVLNDLTVFDSGEGIDQYDALGQRTIERSKAPLGLKLEDVLDRHFEAIGGAKAWGKLSGITTQGSVEYGGGMSLQHREDRRFSQKKPAIRTELSMAGAPVLIRVVEPTGGQELQIGQVTDMDEKSVQTMMSYLSPTRLMSMNKNGFSGSILGKEDVDGSSSIVVEFKNEEVTETYWFRESDGLLIQRERPALDGSSVVERLEQYIDFAGNGMKVAAIRTSIVGGQTMTIRTATVTFNPEFADNAFELQP